MFKNIRYVDPKLWYENEIPDVSINIGVGGLIGVYPFNNDNLQIYQQNTNKIYLNPNANGFLCYDVSATMSDWGDYNDLRNKSYTNGPIITQSIPASSRSLVSGYEDNFCQKFIGFVRFEQSEAGTYYFQAYGDDRALLYVDGNFVVYSSQSENISYEITAGYHFFEFYHMEGGGSQNWYLRWKTPGSGSFSNFPCSRVIPPLANQVKYINPSTAASLVEYARILTPAGMLNRNHVEDYKITYETVKGAYFNDPKTIENNGYTLENAKFFSDETNDGTTVSGNTTDSNRNMYYRVKLKGGVTYTFVYTYHSFDVRNALYREDGSVVIDSFDNDSTNERMDYTPATDGNYVFRVHPYSTSSGSYTYSVTPAPEQYKQQGNIAADSSFLYKDFTSQDLSNNMTVSFWFNPDGINNMQGNLISLNDKTNNISTSSLFLDGDKIYLYNGTNSILLYTFTQDRSEFYLKGRRYYCNIAVRKRASTGFDLFINGSVAYTSNTNLPITGDRFIIGDAYSFTGNKGVFKGHIKVLRIYNDNLSNSDISKIYKELSVIPGDGKTYNNPYGQIPKTIEDDTLYLLRRYNDGTYTRIEFNSDQTATKVGIYGFPSEENSDSEFMELLPDNIKQCPWYYDDGIANFYQANPNHRLISSTIKHFECRNLNILSNQSSNYYLFELSSDKYNYTLFDKCRFSCYDSDIDKPNGTVFNTNDKWYYRHNSGRLQNLVITNCTIVFCNTFYDAFRCNYCTNAYIVNNNIYSTQAESSDYYNGFCFTFIRNCENTYSSEPYSGRERYYLLERRYDNSTEGGNYFSGNTSLNYLTFKDNNFILKHHSSNRCLNGLICATNVNYSELDNVKIFDENNLGTPTASPINYNGLIYLRGLTGYKISNIDINLKYSKAVGWLPVFNIQTWYPEKSMAYNDYGTNYPNYSANYDRIIENVNIRMGDQYGVGSDNDSGNVNYNPTESNTSIIQNELMSCCAFSFKSLNNRSYYVDIAKNINITAPGTGGVFLQRTTLEDAYLYCPLRAAGCRANIDTIRMKRDLPAIYLWFDNNIKVDTVSYDLPNATSNVISYGIGYESNNFDSSRFVYIENCNKRIIENKFFGINTDSSTYNDSIIYCPNTIGIGGLTYQSYLHGLFPSEYYRIGGNPVSLAIRRYSNKIFPFAMPIFPNKGVKKQVTAGKKKLKIHFASFGKTLSELITQSENNQFFIQLEVENKIYDSRLYGEFKNTSEVDLWSDVLLEPFVYELNFRTGTSTTSYLRIYFNIPCSDSNLLLFDPLYEIEDRS